MEVEGRLNTGCPLNKSRSIVRGIRVALMYVADHRPHAFTMTHTVNLNDTCTVIRAGIPL